MSDLISRQAAIDALDEQIELCNKALGSFDIALKDEYAIKVERASLEAFKGQLINIPTVQPERKKGEWTKDASCPFCGFKPWYEGDIHTLSFCPNCGADMRGEQNG